MHKDVCVRVFVIGVRQESRDPLLSEPGGGADRRESDHEDENVARQHLSDGGGCRTCLVHAYCDCLYVYSNLAACWRAGVNYIDQSSTTVIPVFIFDVPSVGKRILSSTAQHSTAHHCLLIAPSGHTQFF